MTHLERIVGDLHRCFRHMPGHLPPQFAWRLSPEDWDACLRDLAEFKRTHSDEPNLPVDELYVLGIRVFKDPTCPDLLLEA